MPTTFLLVTLAFVVAQPEKEVTDTEKQEFFKVLAKLPTRGEFFTDEGIKKAAPYTRVLLALTEQDVKKDNIYPFLALSGGLIGQRESREYAVANFSKIAHPTIKLGWAIGLFREKPSPEVVAYLRTALDSKADANTLSSMLGPGFEDFKDRVIRTDEARRLTKIELVKQHEIAAFPKYGGGLDFTKESLSFAPGRVLYGVRPLKQQGELSTYNLADSKTSRLVVPQPAGFKAKYDFERYFDNQVLTINSGGDLFCRWMIEGNGDNGLALLKKGSDTFQVKRAKADIYHSRAVADPSGGWYLIGCSARLEFKVYQVDSELKVKQLGIFNGKGHHSTNIHDARFISKDVVHVFWGDVLPTGNYLRMRCVDFNVKNQQWLHSRELFKLDKFVSSANEPTVLQLKDDSLHYIWRIDEGAKRGESTGLYYQAEVDGKTIKVASACEYRAIAIGDRIVICYTQEDSPEKVFFRVIQHGTPGPVSEIISAKDRKDNLSMDYMQIHEESDRIWFVNTLVPNTLYELKMVDERKP